MLALETVTNWLHSVSIRETLVVLAASSSIDDRLAIFFTSDTVVVCCCHPPWKRSPLLFENAKSIANTVGFQWCNFCSGCVPANGRAGCPANGLHVLFLGNQTTRAVVVVGLGKNREQFERAMALAGGIGTLALRSAASVDSRLPDEYIRTVRALSLKDASAEKPPPPLPPPPPLAPPPPSASTRFTDAQAQLSDLRGSDSASYIDVGPISEAELIVLLRSGYFQRVPQPDGRYVHFTKEDFRFLILSRRSLPGTQSGWPRQQ